MTTASDEVSFPISGPFRGSAISKRLNFFVGVARIWTCNPLIPNEARTRTILENSALFVGVSERLFAFGSREAVAELPILLNGETEQISRGQDGGPLYRVTHYG